MANQKDLQSKILDSVENGLFLECIYDFYKKNFDKKQELFSILVELHNLGKINLFKEFIRLNNEAGRIDFWMTRHILEDMMALIDIKCISESLKCIEHLIKEAGNDLASHSILGKFQQKLESDEDLLEQVFEVFQENPILYKEFLGAIILVGSNLDFDKYFNINQKFLDSTDNDIKSRAIYLLGKFAYPSEACLKTSIKKLELLGEKEANDTVLSSILHSYLTLLFLNPSYFDNTSEIFLQNIIAKSGKITFYNLATLLFFHRKSEKIDDYQYFNLTRKVYNFLKNKLASEVGTIQYIGMAFPTKNQDELLKDYLELIEFYIENGVEIELFGIKHFIEDDIELFEKIITRWFSSNSSKIALATRDFFILNDVRLIQPNFDLVDSDCGYLKTFIAHKAVSCLFAYPEMLLHFLIHLMEASTEAEASDIANLIYHFILINYPHQKENTIKWKNNLHPHNQIELDRIAEEIENYLQNIKSIPEIKELHPPTENIIEYDRYQSETMARQFDDISQKSVFMQLFTPIRMLYGHKAIFKQELNQQGNRTEIEMVSHSVSMAMPRMLLIDKDDFEFGLKIFLLERYNNEANS